VVFLAGVQCSEVGPKLAFWKHCLRGEVRFLSIQFGFGMDCLALLDEAAPAGTDITLR
jgi:hypothetical protein